MMPYGGVQDADEDYDSNYYFYSRDKEAHMLGMNPSMDHSDASRFAGYQNPQQASFSAHAQNPHGMHRGAGVQGTQSSLGGFRGGMSAGPSSMHPGMPLGRGNLQGTANLSVSGGPSQTIGAPRAMPTKMVPKFVGNMPNPTGVPTNQPGLRGPINAGPTRLPMSSNMNARSLSLNPNMMQTPPGMNLQAGYTPSGELLSLLNKGMGGSMGLHQQGMTASMMNQVVGNGLVNESETPFELSEFPALSRSSEGIGSKGLVASGEFTIQKEDFPALPTYKQSSLDAQTSQQTQQQMQQLQQQSQLQNQDRLLEQDLSHYQNQGYQGKTLIGQQSHHQSHFSQMLPSSNLRAGNQPSFSQYDQYHMNPQQSQQQQQQQQQQTLSHQAMPILQPQMQRVPPQKKTVGDRFGLLGLLSVIRMTDPDLNTLALGTDLTTLGLNLNSPDQLHATFASPWADTPSRREPEFYLPTCYQMPAVGLQPDPIKFHMFSTETLLYIFYSMPRDILQMHAALELYIREWRYHKTAQRWMARAPGTEHVKTPTLERGSYIFFEPTTWEKIRKDNYVLVYDQLDERPPISPPISLSDPSWPGSNAPTSHTHLNSQQI